MKTFKKGLTIIIVLNMITIVLSGFSIKAISKIPTITSRRTVKAGVLIYSSDVFSSRVAKSLEDIQKENENKIKFTLFNGEGSLIKQSELLDKMLKDNYDLILANIADKMKPEQIDDLVYKSRQKNIPLIFFNVTPTNLNTIKSYHKSLIINNDSKQAGVLQGKMIADLWNTNREAIDKNRDNILQYVIIKGIPDSFSAEERSKYSISTINETGIKIQELVSINANWSKEVAENSIESLFLGYADKIEAIIANSDSMAIGAIEALQKYGYNIGNKAKTIPTFGIGGIPEAQDLIKKGFMAGSVFQDPRSFADALYTVGMNLISNKNPLEGTNYKFDETGVVILIPFEKNIVKNEKQ